MDEIYNVAGRQLDRFYHATPASNEASIDAEGLKPFFGWRTSWDKFRSERSETRTWEICPVHLSLGYSFEELVFDLHGADEVVIYEVDVHGLTLEVGYDGPGTFTVREWIAPSRLKKVDRYVGVVDKEFA